jgi:hypothetical protein
MSDLSGTRGGETIVTKSARDELQKQIISRSGLVLHTLITREEMSVIITTTPCDCSNYHPAQRLATPCSKGNQSCVNWISPPPRKSIASPSCLHSLCIPNTLFALPRSTAGWPHVRRSCFAGGANRKYICLHTAARSTYSYRRSSPVSESMMVMD